MINYKDKLNSLILNNYKYEILDSVDEIDITIKNALLKKYDIREYVMEWNVLAMDILKDIIHNINPNIGLNNINIEFDFSYVLKTYSAPTNTPNLTINEVINLFKDLFIHYYEFLILNKNPRKFLEIEISYEQQHKFGLAEFIKKNKNEAIKLSKLAIKTINPKMDNTPMEILFEKYPNNIKTYSDLNANENRKNKLIKKLINEEYKESILKADPNILQILSVDYKTLKYYGLDVLIGIDPKQSIKFTKEKIKKINPDLKDNKLVIEYNNSMEKIKKQPQKVDFTESNKESNDSRDTPEYRKWKQEVLNRDMVCQCCGGDKRLEVHHIFGFKDNPDYRTNIDNGITLCKWCHEKYHSYYGRKNVNPIDLANFIKRFGI